jgi:hypothetical protein
MPRRRSAAFRSGNNKMQFEAIPLRFYCRHALKAFVCAAARDFMTPAKRFKVLDADSSLHIHGEVNVHHLAPEEEMIRRILLKWKKMS